MNALRLLKIGFVVIALPLSLTACDRPVEEPPVEEPPGEEPPGDDPSAGPTYRISGVVENKRYDGIVQLRLQNHDTHDLYQQLELPEGGPFEFSRRVAEGDAIAVYLSSEPVFLRDDDFLDRQDCFHVYRDRDVRADVFIEFACDDRYHVFVSVEGLIERNANDRPDLLHVDLHDIAFGGFFERSKVRSVGHLPDGSPWEVSIDQQPSNPDQTCHIEGPSTGTFAGADAHVRVLCDRYTISGEVIGLIGGGMEVTLSLDEESGGSKLLLDVESLTIDANGRFEFEGALPVGAYYEVAVRTQPTEPAQTCVVENGIGTVTDTVTDVVVRCPTVRRIYTFHDVNTLRTTQGGHIYGAPILCRDVPGGEIFERLEYPMHLPGQFSGFLNVNDVPQYYLDYLDPPPTEGIVYSSSDGFSYWLGTDSGTAHTVRDWPEFVEVNPYPCENLYDGPIPPWPGNIVWNENRTTLYTFLRLRKDTPDATLSFVINHVNLIGHLDPSFAAPCDACLASIDAAADFEFELYLPVGPDYGPVERTGGTVVLYGDIKSSGPGMPPLVTWEYRVRVESDMQDSLFGADDFLFNGFAAPPAIGANRVGTVSLPEPIEVELDLTNVPQNSEFVVALTASVDALNYGSAEGGAAAFLRDPGEFDASRPELSGVSMTEMSGVTVLDFIDQDPLPLLAGGVLPVAECENPSAPRSVIEFSQSEFSLTELARANLTQGEVLVTRTGALEGDVGATISTMSGSALLGEDFAAEAIAVRFGDLDDVARTVNPQIIDDTFEEDAETFTLELHSPEGCADIGAQSTATVTIVANDPPVGVIAFSTDAVAVDESAGEAVLEVQRTGGEFGAILATVSTTDVSAASGEDYVAVVAESVFFDHEDTAPKVVRIPIINDLEAEPDESLQVALSERVAGTVVPPSSATVTIIDDDGAQAGSFEFGAASYSVAETAGSVTVEVRRLDSAAGTASVTVSTVADTAQPGFDYTETSTMLHFADGDATPQSVDIPILDDAEVEGDHRFSAILTDPIDGVLGTLATTVINIVDDEGVNAQPPAAPLVEVTVDGTDLRFSWTPTPEATYFRLYENPDGVSGFSQVGDDIPGVQTTTLLSVAVHLVDWNNAVYQLEACNSAGCSTSLQVPIGNAMLDAIGFFKASNAEGSEQAGLDGDYFGQVLDVSADGRTIVVGTEDEDSDAVYIDGDGDNNIDRGSGAAYVFSRGPDGWFQQAYVKAPNTEFGARFGHAVALSADGNRLVVTADRENGGAAGVNGDLENDDVLGSGAAYVYQRTGSVWTFGAYIKPSNPGMNDHFGHAVALSDDGNTLVVSALDEDNAATGVDPVDVDDDDAPDSGAVYVFEYDGSAWAQTHYLKASNAEAGDWFGHAVALSGDGTRMVVSALREDSAATGVNGDQSDNTLADTGGPSGGTGAAYVFVRDGSSWLQEAYVKASNTGLNDRFGFALAINGDGSRLAVGANAEDSGGTGVNSATEDDNSAGTAGAAYLFENSSGGWVQVAYVKASNTVGGESFGYSMGFDAAGELLAIGAPREDGTSVGINGSETQGATIRNGAVYVYRRDVTTGVWSKIAYVKASNADVSKFEGSGRSLGFGQSLALDADGEELAVGAPTDSSDAIGIGGDQLNENATRSGAMFLY